MGFVLSRNSGRCPHWLCDGISGAGAPDTARRCWRSSHWVPSCALCACLGPSVCREFCRGHRFCTVANSPPSPPRELIDKRCCIVLSLCSSYIVCAAFMVESASWVRMVCVGGVRAPHSPTSRPARWLCHQGVRAGGGGGGLQLPRAHYRPPCLQHSRLLPMCRRGVSGKEGRAQMWRMGACRWA